MRSYLLAFCLLLSGSLGATAQLQIRPLSAPLRPYTACKLNGGPDLVEITPLVARNSVRTVQTLHGDRQVKLVDGARLMFSYPDSDFFANVKIEQLPVASYTQGKSDLISNFDKLLAVDDSAARNYALKPAISGFEIYGLDRKELQGSTLGIYVFFDDAHHVVTTVYFLNAEPAHRKFATMEEYTGYRDQFLAKYTACVRGKLDAAPTPAPIPATKR